PVVRARTGLVLDPYFSATKAEWLLTAGGVEPGPGLALSTVDAWVLWNLTGGARGGTFATDPSNASRTLLYDIVDRRWSEELCAVFGMPPGALPEVRPSSGRLGVTPPGAAGALGAGIPVSGLAGDQAAALFGQACLRPGMAKTTYGTGSFVLLNVGPAPPPPADGLLTSVAWDLSGARSAGAQAGDDDPVAYALEGSIFSTGSAVQWLRDGLGIIAEAAEIGPLAASVPGSEGVVLVPAFTGLGSPWWDPWARGAVVGLTRGVGRAHLARAALEAMAHQTRDVMEAMASAWGAPVECLRVDGGASVVDLLLQIQADQLGLPVARPRVTETTALGAALLAGLAEGVWGSLDEVAATWALDAELAPSATRSGADARHGAWRLALDRSRRWAAGER
ncbi:MAG: FGGY family carbohydrate kinase, partial [Acidimicrobiales bacterium]